MLWQLLHWLLPLLLLLQLLLWSLTVAALQTQVILPLPIICPPLQRLRLQP